MVRVQPDRIFGGLAEVLGIRTIVHDSIMHGRATGIVCRPPDNRKPVFRQRDLWPLDDLYARGFWSRWTFLSEQAAAQDHDRQCQKGFIHIHASQRINSEWLEAKKPRSTAIRDLWLRLVRSHPMFCDTDEQEKRCHWFRAFAV